jgi:two-component system, OmpR family, response regulator
VQILIVDDDPELSSVIARALALDGHTISAVASLAEARNAPFRVIDLMILDLALPDGSGIELCYQMRQRAHAVRILVLTGNTRLDARVSALEAGADDYVCKPVELAELRARVRALGRRAPIWRPPIHVHNDVVLDFDGRRAMRAGAVVPVTAREWSILDFLPRARVVSTVATIC